MSLHEENSFDSRFKFDRLSSATLAQVGTVKPRFTNASDHEQFGLRTNFPNTKPLR
jgi:hypothetical protein